MLWVRYASSAAEGERDGRLELRRAAAWCVTLKVGKLAANSHRRRLSLATEPKDNGMGVRAHADEESRNHDTATDQPD